MDLSQDESILKKSIIASAHVKKKNSSLMWGTVNATLTAILYYDASLLIAMNERNYVYYVELALIVLFTLNSMFHFARYLYNQMSLTSIEVTEEERSLLGLKDESICKLKKSKFPCETPASSPFRPGTTPIQASTPTWMDSSNSFQSVSSLSWMYRQSNQTASTFRKSPSTSNRVPDTSGVEFIDDERSLERYLNDYETNEKKLNASRVVEEEGGLANSFWNLSATRACSDVSSYLRGTTYQLASQAYAKIMNNQTMTHSEAITSGFTFSDVKPSEIWSELNVDSDTLTRWHANLRMWISQTILERLVAEIDSVDKMLAKHGFSDVKIGFTSLERLRKTARTQQCLQYMPTLHSLIPFLELSTNQEYLVRRIRELARGGGIGEYRWNSGGSFNGKVWDENLPTDASIIMHLICTYLDSQLLPLPGNLEMKPFVSRHFVKGAKTEPLSTASVVIREVTDKPPHYEVLVRGKVLEVTRGRNNLFHAWLLFIYEQNVLEYGMMARVNLGKSGINMLWIIGK